MPEEQLYRLDDRCQSLGSVGVLEHLYVEIDGCGLAESIVIAPQMAALLGSSQEWRIYDKALPQTIHSDPMA